MKYIKNKTIKIEGVNGKYTGRVMRDIDCRYNDHDYKTPIYSDINDVISDLSNYIENKIAENEIKKQELEKKLLTEEGKINDKIEKFLKHTKRSFKEFNNIICLKNNELVEEFYDNENYINDTGTGDDIWNKKVNNEINIFMENKKNEIEKFIEIYKIKYTGEIIDLFYFDIPLEGNIPIIDWNNEIKKSEEATKKFILNCELI